MKRLSTVLCVLVISVIASPVLAVDVILAFDHPHSPSTSLDGAARTNLIVGQLKRLGVAPGIVLVRTSDITVKNNAWLPLWNNAGYLVVNSGHRHHLLSRLDPSRYQTDLRQAHQRLLAFSGYRQHALLSFPNGAVLLELEQNFASLPVAVRVKSDTLNQLFQRNSLRYRQLNMAQLQQDIAALIADEVINLSGLHTAVAGRTPLIVSLEVDDITAYVLPAMIDELQARGISFSSALPSLLGPYWPVFAANLHTHEGFHTALSGNKHARPNRPLVIDLDVFVRQSERYGFSGK